MRLGVACKILGQDIPSHDARKWQSAPHLRHSIAYLMRMFDYLHANKVRMYRMSSDVAPYFTDPTRPQFGRQLDECREELSELGGRARKYDLRLSTHPGQFIVLNSPRESTYLASVADLKYHADLLDYMELPETARIVLHLGGVYGEREAAMRRWIERYRLLPANVRKRLVIENDDKSYPVDDALAISHATGVPVVFDVLHHAVLNPRNVPQEQALRAALSTWPKTITPKIHYSDARTDPRMVKRSGAMVEVSAARGQHADYINADRFAAFLRASVQERAFDVMVEAKAKDLAVFRLRDDLARLGLAAIA